MRNEPLLRIVARNMRIAGDGRRPIDASRHNPFTGEVVGTVPKATLQQVRETFEIARAYQPTLSRFDRVQHPEPRRRAGSQPHARRSPQLITAESGLCLKDSTYEAGRVADVLMFGANEVPARRRPEFSPATSRRMAASAACYTLREPLLGVITAITPFNHPMNQVAHKVVPSVATNNRMVLKPSEKVPLSALLFADLLYEAGLPPDMLSVLTGEPREIADELLTHPRGGPRHLHRRRGHRQVHRRQGGLPPHGAGARRQRPDHRDGRRRSRRGLDAGRSGLLQELGPALHRGQTHAGARKGRASASPTSWSTRPVPGNMAIRPIPPWTWAR